MSGIALNSVPYLEFGSLDEIRVALLFKWIDEDIGWDDVTQLIVLHSTHRGDIVSILLVDIDNSIDWTISAPFVVLVCEFDGRTCRANMGSWRLLNQVEAAIETEEEIHLSVTVLWLDVDFD